MSVNCSNLLPNLLELSLDLKFLLQSSVMTDFSICVNNKDYVRCHKDILIWRSRWFRAQIEEAEAKKVAYIQITENRKILEVVLYYIYSGNLQFIESLDVPLIDLHQAAKKYGLISLEKLLAKTVEANEVKVVTKPIIFEWKLYLEASSVLQAECSIMETFSVCGTDKWKLIFKPMCHTEDVEPRYGIYIVRQTTGVRRTSHFLTFTVCIINCIGMERQTFSSQNTFVEDGEFLLIRFLTHSEITKTSNKLFSGDLLTLSCRMSVCAKVGYCDKFRIEDPYRRFVSNELIELSDVMYRLYKSAGSKDIKFRTPSYTVNIHSYIFFARTRLPQTCINSIGIQARLGYIGWSSFIGFLYTGQARYLEDHGRDVYSALSLTTFADAKRKYSIFLSNNLTIENAFFIMCDAMRCNDDYLLTAAADFLSRKSNTITDYNVWIKIASDKVISVMEFLPQLHTYNIKH